MSQWSLVFNSGSDRSPDGKGLAASTGDVDPAGP